MPVLDLDTIELSSTLRPVALNGAPSSQDYNDSFREVLTDLAALSSFYNDTIRPLLTVLSNQALLPEASPIGMEGRTVFSDSSDIGPLFYDSLAGKPLNLADSLRYLNSLVSGANTKVSDLTVQVASLQTRLGFDSRADVALALENLTNSVAVLNQQINTTSQRILTGQSVRVSTGSVDSGSIQTVTITWPVPIADSNYSVSLAVDDVSGQLEVVNFFHVSPGISIGVRIRNNSTTEAHTGTVNAVSSQ